MSRRFHFTKDRFRTLVALIHASNPRPTSRPFPTGPFHRFQPLSLGGTARSHLAAGSDDAARLAGRRGGGERCARVLGGSHGLQVPLQRPSLQKTSPRRLTHTGSAWPGRDMRAKPARGKYTQVYVGIVKRGRHKEVSSASPTTQTTRRNPSGVNGCDVEDFPALRLPDPLAPTLTLALPTAMWFFIE